MIVPPSKREDWAGIFLGALLKGAMDHLMLHKVVAFTHGVLDHLDDVETQGKEACMALAVLIHRAGGRVKITRAECEHLKELWMQQRTHDDGDVLEYRLMKQPPRGS